MELSFTEEALDAIAQLAMERETGARGLRAIMVSAGYCYSMLVYNTTQYTITHCILLFIMWENHSFILYFYTIIFWSRPKAEPPRTSVGMVRSPRASLLKQLLNENPN